MVIFIKYTQMCVGVEEYTYVTSVSFFNDPTRSCVFISVDFQFGPMTPIYFNLVSLLFPFIL